MSIDRRVMRGQTRDDSVCLNVLILFLLTLLRPMSHLQFSRAILSRDKIARENCRCDIGFSVVVHCLCVFCLSVAVSANEVYHKGGAKYVDNKRDVITE